MKTSDERNPHVDDRIYRCSDGHLYTSTWLRDHCSLVHLGLGARLHRCPVDHRWRITKEVDANTLTEQQLDAARQHHL
jgi:hypothetical protein